ncbi:MAG: lysoplasmalogenase [Pseudomonadota bacterium]|nr:lysoplasmalogenase [Pseudomonadota bacterium]
MWPLWVGLSALLAIASDASMLDQRALFLLAKPLTTVLLIAVAWQRGGVPRFKRMILIGFGLSLLGDIALMFDGGFVAGLAAFLCAHLVFLRAFTLDTPFLARLWPFAGYAFIAAMVLVFLWPDLPNGLRPAVTVYVLALAVMAAQAMARWRLQRDVLAARAALGALAFVVSDTVLAVNRFHAALPYSGLWVLASYWLALGLIVAALPRR